MEKIIALALASAFGIASLQAQNIGLGTAFPTEKLHISNGQLRLSRSASYANNVVFNMPSSQLVGEHQGLQFQLGGLDKAFIGYTSTSMSGNFIRLSGSGVSNNDLVIADNGNVGIGLNTPSSKLHIAGNVLMDAANPIIQFQNDGNSKGYLQVSGDNLRIGTNSGNSAGNFIIRNNGGDRMYVTGAGNVGIGVADPQAALHINSGSSIEALRLTGNTNTIIRMMTGGTDKANIYAVNNDLSITTVQSNGLLRLNGEVYINNTANRTGIGTTTPEEKLHVVGNIKVSTGKVLNNDNINLVPVAMGKFDEFGARISGTTNITATRQTQNSSFHYFEVTVAGVASLHNAIINVTGLGAQHWGSIGLISGNTVSVLIYDNLISEETSWHPFYIVIYN